ncbi:MAG: ribosome recycling factor [Bacteroidales bacterium]|nr:ribosome recycling factor [Bacteroidales bacterium]
MNEELEILLEDARERMEKTIVHLEKELAAIRAGRANIHILDGVMVDYYGSETPLSQVANIGVPDARTIAIQPWEKTMIGPIERAIQQANLGFNPQNNGEIVRINVPPLTEERRKDLVKIVKNEGESAKVGIRSVRKDANNDIKALQKDGLSEDMAKRVEDQIQKCTNEFSEKTDKILEEKEKDIMTV